jgi:hypothetical protein
VVASLAPCVSRRVTECRRDISTAEWGYETKFVGYTVSGGATLDELRAALIGVEEATRPCPGGTLQRELVRLKLKTAARGLSDEDLALQLVIYAEDLAAYPEDAVVGALRHWAGRNKWWPSWHELKGLLDERCEHRIALKQALERAVDAAMAGPGAMMIAEPTDRREKLRRLETVADRLLAAPDRERALAFLQRMGWVADDEDAWQARSSDDREVLAALQQMAISYEEHHGKIAS